MRFVVVLLVRDVVVLVGVCLFVVMLACFVVVIEMRLLVVICVCCCCHLSVCCRYHVCACSLLLRLRFVVAIYMTLFVGFFVGGVVVLLMCVLPSSVWWAFTCSFVLCCFVAVL